LKRTNTTLPGVWIIEPEIFEDARGHFVETYHREKLSRLGIDYCFVQENQSLSRKGVLRGLHYQLRHPQAKLCRVIEGEVWDVVVDIRVGSPTFARWTGILLSAESLRQIFIPKGFAHGFIARSDVAQFVYKCDDFYRPDDEYGVLWNDSQLAIDWGDAHPELAPRDASYPPLAAINPAQLPRYDQGATY
jgi:dTDP-4-dehydrorhamnose 3,5-epimerase